ncbi:MAG: ATP-grasp domain-containing protein [Planctomycetaceae bacterium]
MKDDSSNLLILGASVRAAAFSALRAGVVPVCGDLFGDVDLRAVAETCAVANYPAGLMHVADAAEPADWLYTGALENHPGLIAAVSRRHRLLGNPPKVLATVRDPFRVAAMLRAAGLSVLDLRPGNRPPDDGEEWLVKPRRGGGGRGIRTAKPQPAACGLAAFFQRRVRGTPVAAVFLASRLNCRLIGTTRQLVGEAELHAAPFAYCGSVGPLQLPERLTEQITRTGRTLATGCELRGLFGVDFVVDKATAWPIEVNPRYTASVEVLEYATGRELLGVHRLACRTFLETGRSTQIEEELHALFGGRGAHPDRIIGKGVLFSDRESESVSLDRVWLESSRRQAPRLPAVEAVPEVADVPNAGAHLHAGEPICTTFAEGRTVAGCLNRLFERVRGLHDRLGIPTDGNAGCHF